MQNLGGKIDCANPINWRCWLNRGLVGDYSYIPGLSNENLIGVNGSFSSSLAHDLTKLPGGTAGRDGAADQITDNHSRHASLIGCGGRFRGPNRPGGLGKTWWNHPTLPSGWELAGHGSSNCSYRFSLFQPFSAFCWIRLGLITTNQQSLIGNCWDNTFSSGWQLAMNAKLTLYFVECSPGTVNALHFITRQTTQSPFAIDTWYHVGFTYDGSNSVNGMKLFVNGKAITAYTDFVVGTMIDFNSQFPEIWHFHSNISGTFFNNMDGFGDQARIYSRCLPQFEVKSLFDESRAGSPNLYNRLRWQPSSVASLAAGASRLCSQLLLVNAGG